MRRKVRIFFASGARRTLFSCAEKPFRVCGRAFPVMPKSLFRTMKEPVRQSRKNALAVCETPTCCMPEPYTTA